jgi:glycerol-1-phosphate dehydrogenase [NAD(P)+]
LPLLDANRAINRSQLLKLHRLSDLADMFKFVVTGRILLVADDRTYAAAGREASRILQSLGNSVHECILTRPTSLVPDENALAEIRAACDGELDALWAVGSGSINDLMKTVAHEKGIPLITLATAASMDGYTSSVAALTLNGFKETIAATPPNIVLSVAEVLTQAPTSMTAAGVGDLLGKYTSLADWKLGQFITDEPYSEELAQKVREAVTLATTNFGKHDDALHHIMTALVFSGDAMLEWGNSRPASGSEHHLSHFWELEADRTGRTPHLHGHKVGVATVLMTDLYHRIFAFMKEEVEQMMIRFIPETEEAYRQRIEGAYGEQAETVMKGLNGLYRDEVKRGERQLLILEHWDEMKAWVKAFVPKPEEIRAMLRECGAPVEPGKIEVDGELLVKTLQNAKEMRSRYTVLRLAEDLGSATEIYPWVKER